MALPVYLSLIPVCAGVAIASAGELSFTWACFGSGPPPILHTLPSLASRALADGQCVVVFSLGSLSALAALGDADMVDDVEPALRVARCLLQDGHERQGPGAKPHADRQRAAHTLTHTAQELTESEQEERSTHRDSHAMSTCTRAALCCSAPHRCSHSGLPCSRSHAHALSHSTLTRSRSHSSRLSHARTRTR
eukprot:1843814-Rhodomonas_salina.2